MANLLDGLNTCRATNATARLRSRDGRDASRRSKPKRRIAVSTARTCPCGLDSRVRKASSITRTCLPCNAARTNATISSPNGVRFASVSFFTVPPSRYERMSRCAWYSFSPRRRVVVTT